MVNLASSEAIVMVTLDNAEEELSTPSGSTLSICPIGGAMGGADLPGIPGSSGLSASSGNAASRPTTSTGLSGSNLSNHPLGGSEPMVVVHRGKVCISVFYLSRLFLFASNL